MNNINSDLKYIKKSIALPVLSAKEEELYFISWKENGDSKAFEHLILSFDKLVISIASKFHRHYPLNLADLLQEGRIGLMQAAQRFDPALHNRFSAYAKFWVKARIQDYIFKNWSLLHNPQNAKLKQIFFYLHYLRNLMNVEKGQVFDMYQLQEVCEKLKITLNELNHAQEIIDQHFISVDHETDDNKADHSPWFINSDPSAENCIMTSQIHEKQSQMIKDAFENLNEREIYIIQQRFFISNPQTLAEIGVYLNISKERTRQIESAALKKLHKLFTKNMHSIKDLVI